MRINYEGQSYDFEMTDLTVKQAIKIEKYLGCPIAEFSDRLFPQAAEGEPPKNPDMAAMQCLGWLILHGGRDVPIEDTDFKVKALFEAVADAMAAQQKTAEAEVPTAAASANGAAPEAGLLTVP